MPHVTLLHVVVRAFRPIHATACKLPAKAQVLACKLENICIVYSITAASISAFCVSKLHAWLLSTDDACANTAMHACQYMYGKRLRLDALLQRIL